MAYDIRSFQRLGLLHRLLSVADADSPAGPDVAAVRDALTEARTSATAGTWARVSAKARASLAAPASACTVAVLTARARTTPTVDYSRHTPCRAARSRLDRTDALGEHIAPWALARVAAGQPVVVRRARRDAGRGLPVGVRGAHRGQQAARLEPGRWQALRTPESWAADGAWIEHPRGGGGRDRRCGGCRLSAQCRRLVLGVTGAVGFELATGERSATPTLPRRAHPRARTGAARRARRLARALEALSAPCDAQIVTPAGGVALADWAGAAKRVLVKSDAGPFLCADPWSESGSADADRRPSSVAESPSG